MVKPARAHTDDAEASFNQLIQEISEEYDADICGYAGPVVRPFDDRVIEECERRRRRTNVLLILTTSGGDAHAGYRIARAFQTHYAKFIIFVPGYCKSAGTLIAIGAHEIVLANHAEFGPLDAQIERRDDVNAVSSGLTPGDALILVQENAASTLLDVFRRLKEQKIPTKLAADMATKVTANMYRGLVAQVDAIRLAEHDRSNRVATEYGKRLSEHADNIGLRQIYELAGRYPSHGFVIDFAEASKLFKRVRSPSPKENLLSGFRWIHNETKTSFVFFSKEPAPHDPRAAHEPRGGTAEGADARNASAGNAPVAAGSAPGSGGPPGAAGGVAAGGSRRRR